MTFTLVKQLVSGPYWFGKRDTSFLHLFAHVDSYKWDETWWVCSTAALPSGYLCHDLPPSLGYVSFQRSSSKSVVDNTTGVCTEYTTFVNALHALQELQTAVNRALGKVVRNPGAPLSLLPPAVFTDTKAEHKPDPNREWAIRHAYDVSHSVADFVGVYVAMKKEFSYVT